jgi:hypothetical protein
MWIGVTWLEIRPVVGILECGNKTSGSTKYRKVFD